MKEDFKLFTGLIASINRNIRRVKTEIMAEHSLKCPHVSTIYYLYTEKDMTLKSLCEKCNEDKGAISRSVKSLEEEGLVDSSSINKKYKNKIKLTEKGKEIGKIIVKKIDIAIESAIQGLTEEDKQSIYKALTIIKNNLQKFNLCKV